MSQNFGSLAPVVGIDGKSAYEVAIANGFAGTQTEWLESLKGDAGADGNDGQDGVNGDTIIDQRTQMPIKMWTGTQSQYDAVTPKDASTLYVIKP